MDKNIKSPEDEELNYQIVRDEDPFGREIVKRVKMITGNPNKVWLRQTQAPPLPPKPAAHKTPAAQGHTLTAAIEEGTVRRDDQDVDNFPWPYKEDIAVPARYWKPTLYEAEDRRGDGKDRKIGAQVPSSRGKDNKGKKKRKEREEKGERARPSAKPKRRRRRAEYWDDDSESDESEQEEEEADDSDSDDSGSDSEREEPEVDDTDSDDNEDDEDEGADEEEEDETAKRKRLHSNKKTSMGRRREKLHRKLAEKLASRKRKAKQVDRREKEKRKSHQKKHRKHESKPAHRRDTSNLKANLKIFFKFWVLPTFIFLSLMIVLARFTQNKTYDLLPHSAWYIEVTVLAVSSVVIAIFLKALWRGVKILYKLFRFQLSVARGTVIFGYSMLLRLLE